jgi:glycosyltransferase involved in cell wall biosynthesis
VGNPDLSPPERPAPPILLNRRAATRPTITGVERWTAEIIPRLRALDPERYEVVQPRPRLRRRGRAQAWEQLWLPVVAARRRAELVFSPANLAPLAWPRNVLVVHDAAVLREPGAYSATYRAWHRSVGLACARRALRVVTVSEFSRRELVDTAGLDPGRIAVVPGGVDSRFTPAASREGVAAKLGLARPYVLTVATEDPRKNLVALGDAARRLKREGIELVRAGDARPYFAAELAGAGLRSLGYVEEGDLPGLYAGARAFVLPSRYEGFGLTCLEAMASGVPVVAADRGALPETCGSAALLVDPDDRPGITEALLTAVFDDPARRALIAAGRSRAARFTWDETAAQLDVLLRDTASAA